MYIFLSQSHLEKEKDYKIEDVEIAPECFDKLFVFVNNDITKINYKYERCKRTKTKSRNKNIS